MTMIKGQTSLDAGTERFMTENGDRTGPRHMSFTAHCLRDVSIYRTSCEKPLKETPRRENTKILMMPKNVIARNTDFYKLQHFSTPELKDHT
ncbi:hypothetical protein J6590_050784 [Homalodisca vitripennis]|nr:hypothetical protein J6590_050784 [Homalodisca vitripennis]